MAETGLS